MIYVLMYASELNLELMLFCTGINEFTRMDLRVTLLKTARGWLAGHGEYRVRNNKE